MKESNYNFYINDSEEKIHLIYNSLKNTLISDQDCRVQNFIKQCKNEIQFNPEYLSKEEYRELISSGIIVSDEADELQTAINNNDKKLEILQKKSEKLSLVITPTLRCNFKCFYCFESTNIRKNEDSISAEIQNDIFNFITKSITNNHIKEVEIGWYGGEPLIQKSIIFSMQEKSNKICKLYNVKVSSHIITNGILLTAETCNLLKKHGITKASVTIDGPEHLHNKRRYYPANPTNNYNLILENINRSKENIQFQIRANIDQTNKNYIFDLINDLIKRGIWPHKNIRLYTACVESSSKTDLSKNEFAILEDQVRRYLTDKYNEINQTSKAKLEFTYPIFGGDIRCGYGISQNMWVISYNGDVFRCWEAVGQKDHIAGTMKDLLKDFGQSIFEKTKVDNQTFGQWGCFECKFFPICGVGCPWDFLNKKEKRRCTIWKSVLEYRILNQYKSYLKEPEIFKRVPFNVG